MSFSPLLRQRIATAVLAVALLTALAARALAQQAVPTVPNAFALTPHAADHDGVDALLHSFDKRIDFTENRGQFGPGVLYRADFPLGQAVATPTGMVISTFDPASVDARAEEGERLEKDLQDGKPFRPMSARLKGHAWAMDFVNSAPGMRVSARKPHGDPRNYFGATAARSAANVRSYQEVWYENVYDRVDVRYYPAEDGTLEYDVVCKPGSDPGAIAIRFTGIGRMELNAKGGLVLHTSVGDVELPAPVVYQRIGGRQRNVDARYELRGNVLRFRLGAYDREQPLVIDPIALRWATWVNTNSTGDNHGHCIWVDPSDGAIYVVARVVGTTDQITPGAFDNTANGNLEMIVGKYTEPASIGQAGTRVWQTYIGGSGDDNPYAMEQGPDGNLYITGYTSSTNYPLLGGSAFSGSSYDQRAQASNNIFITKINTAGNSIKSAVVGGNGDDGSFDVRIDNAGDLVVCGNTRSTNLATLYSGSGASNTNNGDVDVVVFKLNADLSALSWMKNYGGSGTDQATIMLQNNTTGDIFVGGYTTSTNFPTVSPRQSTRGGSQAGFLQRLTGTGTVSWSSYFQSANSQSASILCMEFNTAKDQIYFGGVTSGLAASNVSASGAYDNTQNGSNDFYVCRMGIDQTFVKSTYLGGTNNEVNMMGLNTDQNNDVYVFGYTNSTNFPVTATPNTALQSTNQGSNDKTFTKLSADLSSLLFSTYYGGTQDDYDPVGERGIKFSNCRIYTIVTSRSTNLPLTQGALNTTKNSGTGTYEPGLVVWANPPDLLGNTITGNQSVCAGSVPGDITGSVPAYVLPTISRNNANSSYPAIGSATSYQWQISTDSLTWSDIPGATAQNLSGSLIGTVNAKTYVRRVIGGDACILAGAADQVVTVKLIGVTAQVQQVSCNGFGDGTITAICDGVAPFSYAWSNGQTTQTATGLAPGDHTVTVTDHNGCTATGTFTMTQPAVLGGTTGTTPATCGNANGTASVSVSGGTTPYTYLWSEGSTTAAISDLAGGSYSVTVTDGHGCILQRNAAVDATTVPNVSAGADAAITCATGPSIQLNGSSSTPGVSYSWSASNGGNIVSGAGSATPTVNAAGTYTLTVTNTQTGCSANDAMVVTLDLGAPNASALAGGTLTCAVTSVMLNGGSTTPNATFAWTGPNGFTSSEEDPMVSAPGTYVLTVTAANGCTNTANAQVGQNIAVPNASAQGGTVTCAAPSVMLNGGSTTPNVTFAWTGPNGFTSSDEDPTASAPGTYVLTVTAPNGCTNTASAMVVEDIVTIEASAQGGTLTCAMPTVTLHGSSSVAGVTYAWTGPNGFTSNDQDPVVNTAGQYDLTVTAENGCMGTASAQVQLDRATPNANASGDVITCSTPMVMLDGGSTTPNVTFAWTGPNGFTSNDEDPLVGEAGSYLLTVTAANGCSNTASATVTLDTEAPGAQATGGTLTCSTTSVMLMGSGNGDYAWTGPNGFTSNDQNPVVTAAGTYTLVVTGQNGCSSQAAAQVALDNEVPGAHATGGTLTCSSTSVMLMGSGNGDFAWTGPNGFTSNDQNPVVAAAGTYALIVTGDNGCSSQASAQVALDNEAPGAQATGGTLTCNTTSVMLMGSGNGDFAWAGRTGFASNDQNPVVTVAGTYT
ncbi:MAG: SBBP repeat-containing protein, partial [Bacteroidetes bacterium]|nr:SBBP repeat-containing protein [Bacteroidota bacterium]